MYRSTGPISIIINLMVRFTACGWLALYLVCVNIALILHWEAVLYQSQFA